MLRPARHLLPLSFAAAAFTAIPAAPARAGGVLEVRILSSIGGAEPTPEEKRVVAGTEVTLVAAIRRPGAAWFVPRTPRVPPATVTAWRVRWSKVEAKDHYVSNTDPTFHWQPIRYEYVPMPECDDRLLCPANVRATLLGDRGGLGTMAFRVEVSLGEARGASVGYERLFRGGLPPEIARVTVRRDDSYLGYLTELFNTPYIWGSAGDPPTVHQAERRIGSDCADFVAYGVRRLGYDLPYTSTFAIPRYARTLYRSPGPSSDGIYRDEQGRPIPIGPTGLRPGDLLLFRRHVGAFVEDRPPLGVLSTSDVLIHTSWSEPIEQPIAESDYAKEGVSLLRWKAFDGGFPRD